MIAQCVIDSFESALHLLFLAVEVVQNVLEICLKKLAKTFSRKTYQMGDFHVQLIQIAHIAVVITARQDSNVNIGVSLFQNGCKGLQVIGHSIRRNQDQQLFAWNQSRKGVFAGFGQGGRARGLLIKQRLHHLPLIGPIGAISVQEDQIASIY
jgi:hypothetical protein